MNTESILLFIFQVLFSVGIFFVLVYVGKHIISYVKSFSQNSNSKLFKIEEYLPFESLLTLKQFFYLIMILVLIILILYLLFDWGDNSYYIILLDILLSTYFVINIGKDSYINKVMLIFLIPLSSVFRIIFGESLIVLWDFFHIIGLMYFIHVYYRKFMKFTEDKGLGIAIILLFSIILFSFLFTLLVEGVSPMDSITMVTNAFTSNSFEASGKNTIGQIDSLVLAWGGFILSCVGTATLSVSIIVGRVDKKFDYLENLIKKNKKK